MRKAEMLARVAESRQALMDSIAGLTEPAASEIGLNVNWSVKDALSHIVAWEVRGREVVEEIRDSGNTPGHLSRAEIDEFNARVVEERRGRTFDAVCLELGDAHARMLATLNSLSDEIDESTISYKYIFGVTIHHMATHAMQISNYRKNGQRNEP